MACAATPQPRSWMYWVGVSAVNSFSLNSRNRPETHWKESDVRVTPARPALQEQRKQDLQYVQTKVNSLEKNNNQFKQETEQILTSLISSPGKKKNNY